MTAAVLAAPSAAAGEPGLVRLAGTPAWGKESPRQTERWEALERTMHAEKERLREELWAGIDADNPEAPHAEMMDRWSAAQASDSARRFGRRNNGNRERLRITRLLSTRRE